MDTPYEDQAPATSQKLKAHFSYEGHALLKTKVKLSLSVDRQTYPEAEGVGDELAGGDDLLEAGRGGSIQTEWQSLRECDRHRQDSAR